ncbi:hypothetical protein P7L68_18130 [Tistrella mobilis]|uniref:hypothetical protein n=1 Tax=Tistrella mobilis TaxID=171437 RepID=UPI0035580051
MATLRYTVLPAVSAAALLAFVATPSWQSATTGASSTLIRPAAAAALEAPRKADIVTDDSMAQHDPALMRLVGELRARHELDRPDPAGAAAGPAMTSTAGDAPPATATTPVREATVPQAAAPQGPATPRPATAAAEPGLGERLLSAIGDLFDGEGEDQPRTAN